MKTLISTFLLSFLFCAFAQEGWNDVTPTSNYPGLQGIYVLDSENIWIVGEEGTILNTTDGGAPWNEITCPVTYTLKNVHFINADTGWVGGVDNSVTEIMRTTDSGVSWELKELDNYPWGNNDIEFIYGNPGEPPRGFTTAGLSLVWRTDDYGENWVQSPIGGCGSNDLQSICFIDKDEGWFVGEPAAGYEVSIVHTTDGGQTFDIQDNPTDPDIKLNSVCFADNQQGIAVGLDGTILYTSDGGQNWEIRPSPALGYHRWQSVYMTDIGKAWAVGNNGNVAYSTDWGYTWVLQTSGVTCELWEVFFVNDNEGWIVGGGIGHPGVILHTTNGGVVSDVNDNNIATQFELYQNYPNPFNPNTNIRYQIPERSFVTLKVYDVLGNEVASPLNEEKEAGSYEIIFAAERLSSGIYFYQLTVDEFRETKKMILTK